MRFLLALCAVTLGFSATLHYDLYKQEVNQTSPVLLVIGGIHGNEPGSYFAPSILIRHYKITKGAIWVIPNLNRDSIIAFQRGVYGDMNRKFATIAPNDKDAQAVNEIKKLILDKRVFMVLNLHDGHGFYRPKYVNGIMNPSAWGQATIIDQTKLDGAKYGDLAGIASRVTSKTSVVAVDENYEFNVKNTQTKEKDEQMRQSLTFFAINNNKPAFGIEASKNIESLSLKTMYHLKALEEFMTIMGIEFKRDFELNQKTIEKLIADRGNVNLWNKIDLPLTDIRPKIEHIPYGGKFEFSSDNPSVTLLKNGAYVGIYNGFKKVSILTLEKVNFDDSLKEVTLVVDSKGNVAKIDSIINVQKEVLFKNISGYRLNIVGLNKKNAMDIKVLLKDLDKKSSVDISGKIYRAEFYKGDFFCGAILIKFGG